METKAVTGDFMLRAMGSFTPDQIVSTIESIEKIFEKCDKILDKAKMPLTGYMSQMDKAVDVYEGMCSLNGYALTAYNEVYQQLDNPLMIGFANGATETLSQIVLDSITTENTFNMEEYYAVEVADSEIRYEKRVKWNLTLSDFMGIGWLEQGEGMPTLENVETVGIFANLFRWEYEYMGEPDQSLDEYLKGFIRSGEFNHKGYHPFMDFLSVLADVTIVVPIMESIMGWDFITGEDLTDFERGLKAIGAVVDLITFGNGAMLMKAAEEGTLEFVGVIFKTMAVDAAGSGAAYLTGEMLEDLGLPPAAAMILTAIVSGTVTYSAGTYVFKNASGEVLESCSEAELKEILEGIDDIEISAIKGSALEEVIEGSADAIDDVIKGGIGDTNTSLKASFLNDDGVFVDDVLESKYQDYVCRNTSSGRYVRDRLDWKEASDTFAKIKEQGRAFELEKLEEFKKIATDVQEQITIVTNDGTRIRVDAIGYDKQTGELIIQEYKSSLTAPFTDNQIKGFEELRMHGGIIVGEGKGVFVGEVDIPSGTTVEVIRPDM